MKRTGGHAVVYMQHRVGQSFPSTGLCLDLSEVKLIIEGKARPGFGLARVKAKPDLQASDKQFLEESK